MSGCECGGKRHQHAEKSMNDSNNGNIYLPRPVRIDAIIAENSQIKTFVLSFTEQEQQQGFSYLPGQFLMVSIPHCGEAPISISSPPSRPGTVHLSVRQAGLLTNAMHALKPGDIIGLRGPYGKPFALDELAGRDLLFVAGGIGLAPLRSVINQLLDRGHEGRIEILYGSRTPEDIAFKEDLAAWDAMDKVTCRLTVDSAEPGWNGAVGVVTTLLPQVEIAPQTSVALVCGPPLMIRFVMAELSAKGYADERIITTMERHMKCGVGACGHCHMDDRLVCVDGPVFSLAELRGRDVTELR